MRELRTLSAPLQGRPEACPQRHQRTSDTPSDHSLTADTGPYSVISVTTYFVNHVYIFTIQPFYLCMLFCTCMTIFIVVTETVDIVCWLAIYLYLVRLLVFDCGPQARDLDLLILRCSKTAQRLLKDCSKTALRA